jgi:hypothetical protein
VWYWLSRNADDAGRAKLEAALLKPLPGRRRVSAAVREFELELFKRSMTKQAGR